MKSKIATLSRVRKWIPRAAAFALLLVAVPTSGSADQSAPVAIQPLQNAHFKSTGDPACLSSAVEMGDPSNGPSMVLLKADKGCVVPLHFHSAAQEFMVIKGELQIEITSAPTATLGQAGFAYIPGKEPHRVTCTRKSECLWFLTIDGPLDITTVKPGD